MRKPAFPRFRELTVDAINVEWQLHTNWTDGEPSVAEVLATADAKGLSSVAFTEHVRKGTDWFDDFASKVSACARMFPHIHTFLGCETKVMDFHGKLDVDPGLAQKCDVVMGVVHRFPDGKGGYLDFGTMTAEQVADMECELSMGMMSNAPIDILGHPGGMYQRRHGAFPRRLFSRMMDTANSKGIAFEINSSYLVDMPDFLDLCREINPLVSIGSDAHKTSDIGRCRDLLRKALFS
jgi:putative hydrolase